MTLDGSYGDGRQIRVQFSRSKVNQSGAEQEPSERTCDFFFDFKKTGQTWEGSSQGLQTLVKMSDEIRSRCHPVLATQEIPLVEVLNAQISGLQETTRTIRADLEDAVLKQIEERARISELLSEERSELQKEYEQKTAALQKQREALELDSHASERRKIRNSITNKIEKELSSMTTPRSAVYATWGIVFLSAAVCVVAGLFSCVNFITFSDLLSESGVAVESFPSLAWSIFAKGMLSSIISVGALVYAAGSLEKLYRGETAAKRKLEMFNYDLNRASWIIETVLDIQSKERRELPPDWISAVTSGLFSHRNEDSEHSDAERALSALLGYTASAKFGSNGAEFEFGGKQAR